jgi:hypothetical protein
VALVAVSAAVHTTTAMWFAVLVGVALVVSDPRWRRIAIPAAIVGAVVAAWAVLAGPMRGRLVVMDGIWLQAVASKDSLFATEWPLSAWAVNLGTFGLLWAAYRYRSGAARRAPKSAAWCGAPRRSSRCS